MIRQVVGGRGNGRPRSTHRTGWRKPLENIQTSATEDRRAPQPPRPAPSTRRCGRTDRRRRRGGRRATSSVTTSSSLLAATLLELFGDLLNRDLRCDSISTPSTSAATTFADHLRQGRARDRLAANLRAPEGRVALDETAQPLVLDGTSTMKRARLALILHSSRGGKKPRLSLLPAVPNARFRRRTAQITRPDRLNRGTGSVDDVERPESKSRERTPSPRRLAADDPDGDLLASSPASADRGTTLAERTIAKKLLQLGCSAAPPSRRRRPWRGAGSCPRLRVAAARPSVCGAERAVAGGASDAAPLVPGPRRYRQAGRSSAHSCRRCTVRLPSRRRLLAEPGPTRRRPIYLRHERQAELVGHPHAAGAPGADEQASSAAPPGPCAP